MIVSKVVTKRIERIGFFCSLEYVDEIAVDGSADNFMRVFLNEVIKAYVRRVSSARNVRQLDDRRSDIRWKNLSCTIGNITVTLA